MELRKPSHEYLSWNLSPGRVSGAPSSAGLFSKFPFLLLGIVWVFVFFSFLNKSNVRTSSLSLGTEQLLEWDKPAVFKVPLCDVLCGLSVEECEKDWGCVTW